MFRVQKAQWLAPKVRRLEIEAPRVAARHRPGHFVIVRVHEGGERIPLTIADKNAQRGTITLVVQVIGATTERLASLTVDDSLADVVGPLGKPTEIAHFGHVVLVGGGVGTAVIYPQAGAFKAQGNRVTAIMGGRSRPYVILEQELRAICDAVCPCTDDKSYGYPGFVTGQLSELLEDRGQPVDAVITAGPVPMMKAVANLTRPRGIHTVASLNPIMVDGTGMCGGCRVSVNGRIMFACVDGPEFDAHQVDFDALTDRLVAYRDHERSAWERLKNDEGHQCKLAVVLAEPLPTP
jgi:ferredoxin--NADP+ reductase